jgi:LppP/LprE lipoprotein
VRCAEPKLLTIAVAAVVALGLTGCSSGDSTASKTPGPTAPATSVKAPRIAPTVAAGPTSGAASTDPCVVDFTAPAIAKAVSDLPRDPRSNQGWSPEPVAGNYNQCAPLSVVIVKANTNTPNPNTRAVMFHLGQFIPTGVPDTYGFNGIDDSASTGDTVALSYTNPTSNLRSVVRFHWNGNGVELIGNAR